MKKRINQETINYFDALRDIEWNEFIIKLIGAKTSERIDKLEEWLIKNNYSKKAKLQSFIYHNVVLKNETEI